MNAHSYADELIEDGIKAAIAKYGEDLADPLLVQDVISDICGSVIRRLDDESSYYEGMDVEITDTAKTMLGQALKQAGVVREDSEGWKFRKALESANFEAQSVLPQGGLLRYKNRAKANESIGVRLNVQNGKPTGWFFERNGQKIAQGQIGQLTEILKRYQS